MARIVLGATMVRYPLGGMNLWMLGWLVGFQRLGHEVYLVEKSGWPNSCYDLSRKIMTDDCSYGVAVVDALLRRFGLQDNWCFVDASGKYHGMSRQRVQDIFRSADLFVDHEGSEWPDEAAQAGLRVFVDAEPGWCQMQMAAGAGISPINHDRYYTAGANIGTALSIAPTAGKQWRHFFTPVLLDLLPCQSADKDSPFTTVMNWQSHKSVEYNGKTYGQKDVEFARFIDLPRRTTTPLEIAVSGAKVPKQRLSDHGWRVRNADEVAMSFDTYRDYILSSRGEFSVAKNVFVATNCGCISDREGYYMISGRPVVLQDTGFSAHLPCGEGLLAVRSAEEAAAAFEEIERDYARHSKRAREIAGEYFDSAKVLGKLLDELGVR